MRFVIIIAVAAILTPAALSATIAPSSALEATDLSAAKKKKTAREAEGGIPEGRVRPAERAAASDAAVLRQSDVADSLTQRGEAALTGNRAGTRPAMLR